MSFFCDPFYLFIWNSLIWLGISLFAQPPRKLLKKTQRRKSKKQRKIVLFRKKKTNFAELQLCLCTYLAMYGLRMCCRLIAAFRGHLSPVFFAAFFFLQIPSTRIYTRKVYVYANRMDDFFFIIYIIIIFESVLLMAICWRSVIFFLLSFSPLCLALIY